DVAIAESVADTVAHGGITIADLSPLPRLGFKGRGTIAAAQSRGIVVEPPPNRSFRQPDGGLCLVLAPGEIILLANLDGDDERLPQLPKKRRIQGQGPPHPRPAPPHT